MLCLIVQFLLIHAFLQVEMDCKHPSVQSIFVFVQSPCSLVIDSYTDIPRLPVRPKVSTRLSYNHKPSGIKHCP